MLLQMLLSFVKYDRALFIRTSIAVITTSTFMVIFGKYLIQCLETDIRTHQTERNVFRRYYDEQHDAGYFNEHKDKDEQENSLNNKMCSPLHNWTNTAMSENKLALIYEGGEQKVVTIGQCPVGLIIPKDSRQKLSKWLKWMSNPSIDVNSKCKVAITHNLIA